MKEKQATSAQHMRRLFQDCWKITDYLMMLFDTTPKVYQVVIKANAKI